MQNHRFRGCVDDVLVSDNPTWRSNPPGANSGTLDNPIQPLKFRIGSLEAFGDTGGSLEIDSIRIWGVQETILGSPIE